MNFNQDEIIFLLGAGASADARIPTSMEMIEEVESRLSSEWREFAPLYHYVKSAILYSEGIRGRSDTSWTFNIERLVDTLSELEAREDHTIYPFIGNWNMKLTEVGGESFDRIKEFKERIVEELRSRWVVLNDYREAGYYSRFVEFHREYTAPLRIFTLNYDLCLERNVETSLFQRGFHEDRTWNWRLFSETQDEEVALFLYKLHGSVDWFRDDLGNLRWSETPVPQGKPPNIIFGTNYKLSYLDPFLFFIYEFRRFTLESRLIVSIGYGFGDEHINGILGQALKNDEGRRMLCILKTSGSVREREQEILEALEQPKGDQVVFRDVSAKEYMERHMTVEEMGRLFPEEVFPVGGGTQS